MRLASAIPAITTAILIVASFGCSRSEEAESAAAPAEQEAPQAASESSHAPMPSGSAGYDYVCKDGLTFNARIDHGNALITVDGKTLTLAPDSGASGATYSGEGATFVAMGEEAMLSRAGGPVQTCKAK